jgi:23S rRNA pseudouridine955/2504/2580 synthase
LLARLDRRILFEDKGLLVIDKPSGLAVHGGSGVQLGLIEALRAGRSGRFLELAHRLDRDTSGCLMIAKSRAALSELHRLLRAQRVRKSYQLLVCGRWPRRQTVVERPLHRFVTAAGERRVRVDAQGKPARTTFNVLRACDAASWLSARLHSGRTHQIRVHAAASGHPLLGEDKYETAASEQSSKAAGVNRLCLHAVRLSLEWDGATRRIEAPLPPLFAEAWGRLSDNDAV